MDAIKVRVEPGPDRVLHIPLPPDAPEGPLDVTVYVEPVRKPMTAEERRAAAERGAGSLIPFGGSLDDFLRERREDLQREHERLG